METFQILSDQFSHFQHLFHRWLAIFCIISSYIFDLSSSPHTWGILVHNPGHLPENRFIPTYVGHTSTWSLRRPTEPVHPHLRGAYCGRPRRFPARPGSSPHTWGIPVDLGLCNGKLRFIPTYVGHTKVVVARKNESSVHPHIRGAYPSSVTRTREKDGSSPHTWGIPLHPRMGTNRARFIPTYVGHTVIFPRGLVPCHGSSPHTWGIQVPATRRLNTARFIPTYVGHTLDRRKKNGWFQPLFL